MVILKKLGNLLLSTKIKNNKKLITILGLRIKVSKFSCVVKGYKNNQVMIKEEDGTERFLNKNEIIEGLQIVFEGVGNFIKLEKPFNFSKRYPSKWNIIGNNNRIEIKKASSMPVSIGLMCSANNQTLYIDEDCSFGGLYIDMLENDSVIRIGKGCMFSSNIYCINSDGHAIFSSKDSSKIINKSKGICIGDNVWIGRNCIIGKNAVIPSGCIVGIGSVVTSRVKVPENSIVAGNPVKLIKTNITWKRDSVSSYVEKGLYEND